MLRILAVLAVAGALFAGAFASASALGVQAGLTQAGSDQLDVCQTTDVAVVGYGVELDNLTSGFLKVTSVNPACDGAELAAVVKNSAGTTIGTYDGILNAASLKTDGYMIPKIAPTGPIYLADIASINMVITKSGVN